MDMPSTDTKRILRDNLTALCHYHLEKPEIPINELKRRSGVSVASISRIKEAETSVGLDILERLAQVFGLQPWHLLVPGLDPSNPPVTHITEAERELYARIKRAVVESKA